MVRSEKGFLKTREIIALVILLIVVIIVFIPWRYHRHPSRPPDAHAKANLHSIQIALERFYTDHGEYPPYLLGGDIEGWEK